MPAKQLFSAISIISTQQTYSGGQPLKTTFEEVFLPEEKTYLFYLICFLRFMYQIYSTFAYPDYLLEGNQFEN